MSTVTPPELDRPLTPFGASTALTPATNGAEASSVEPTTPAALAEAVLAMRELPPRSDRAALRYASIGVAAYFWLAAALVYALVWRDGRVQVDALRDLIGVGAQPNVAVTVLVGLGIVVTAITVLRVFVDIRLMRSEEDDIEWVRQKGRPGLPFVFLPTAERERAFRQHQKTGEPLVLQGRGRVETLLDERVRRVQISLASADGGMVVPAELRGIAEVRTAAYGAFARYASSLLLLLAVLGTFAGVKTALPELIKAIGTETTDNEGLVNALGAVASAFGANALALVGAVAVGLMAQGISLGRRHLLERLELISAEYLYGRNVAADADPLQAAVTALRATATEMHTASGVMSGVEQGLEELSHGFRDAMQGLADRLHDIVAQQEAGLFDRTGDALLELRARMDDLVRSVGANAQTYAGLAEAVGTRSKETREALQQMQETNAQLAKALQGVVSAGQGTAAAYEHMKTALDRLREQNHVTDGRLQALTGAVAGMNTTFTALDSTLATADKRLRTSEDESRRAWEAVGRVVHERLAEATAGMRQLDARTATALEALREAVDRPSPAPPVVTDPEVPRLLRELVSAVRSQPAAAPAVRTLPSAAPTWRAPALAFGGALLGCSLGAAGLYLLHRQSREEFRAVVQTLQPTLEQIPPALERLRGGTEPLARGAAAPTSGER
jgi:hypothetical protein